MLGNVRLIDKDLLNKMKEVNAKGVYAESFEEAAKFVKELIEEGDTVITMGAGNVNEVMDLLTIDKQ